MRPAYAILAATVALVSAAGPAPAQTEVELRASTTGYRFVDLSHTFESGLVLDALYVRVDGLKELHAGAGYEIQPARWVSFTPILYAVFGNDRRGATLGALVSLERGEWHVLGFVGRFFRTRGDASDYTFLDALDVTRAIGRWEVGASVDAYKTGGDLAWLAGPTLKRNDSLGAWAASARFGYRTELRLIRTISF